MKGKLDLSRYVNSQTLAQAEAICRDGQVNHLNGQQQKDGSTELTGKCVDSFQFVDHPRVLLSADGDRVLHHACDCPAARAGAGMCAHCAALVLAYCAEN